MDTKKKRFVLIDGNAIVHRAYHALPPLTSRDGQIVNAVYGFFSMFLKIIQDLKPSYIAVCFDRAKPTFRKELYVGYQATRPKMSDDLPPQFVLIHEILEKAGVGIFEVDGYEADDLIGTISVEALREKNTEVVIVSGDRDMLQLVNGSVKVAMPIVGITNMTVFDSKAVEEKYSIHPKQIVDYKALVGDASDNYPGVSGVGPKTAATLLKKYQTLESIYEHLADIQMENPGLGQKLAEGAEAAGLAKKLAAIVLDVPITLAVGRCSIDSIGFSSFKKSFEEVGFPSLLKRLSEVMDGEKAKKAKKEEVSDHKQLGLL